MKSLTLHAFRVNTFLKFHTEKRHGHFLDNVLNYNVSLMIQNFISIYQTHLTKKHVHKKTRMHSSRMCTGRSLTVYRSLLRGVSALGGVSSGGVCLLLGGGICSREVSPPRGCLLPGGACSWGGGICSWEVSAVGGGDCLLWGEGVSAPGVSAPRGGEADTPCEQNDGQVQKYYLGQNFAAAGNKGKGLSPHFKNS